MTQLLEDLFGREVATAVFLLIVAFVVVVVVTRIKASPIVKTAFIFVTMIIILRRILLSICVLLRYHASIRAVRLI